MGSKVGAGVENSGVNSVGYYCDLRKVLRLLLGTFAFFAFVVADPGRIVRNEADFEVFKVRIEGFLFVDRFSELLPRKL